MLEKQLPYKHKVYAAIKKDILQGHYAPGDILNERRLSEELGISRTPVREALQMLEQDGWLKMETYKGAVVREFDPHYMRNLSRIRTALEVCALEEAVSNITEKDLEELARIQDMQKKTLEKFDVEAFITWDQRFHSYLYDLSRNQELIHLLRNYYDIFRFLGTQAVLSTEERRHSTLAEHQRILDSLKAGSDTEAVQALKAHMQNTELNILRQLKAREKE